MVCWRTLTFSKLIRFSIAYPTLIIKHFQCRVVVFQSHCSFLHVLLHIPGISLHNRFTNDYFYLFREKVDACELLIADLKKFISTIIFNILIIYYFHTKKPNRGPWATSLIWTTILKSPKLWSFQTQRTESSGLLFKLVIFVYQLTSISPVISRIFYHVSPHSSGKLKS